MASDLMKPITCKTCDMAAAKFYCNTCRFALCPTCKVQHSNSKDTTHHNIVPYAEKLNSNYLDRILCPKHQKHAPKFWCKTCGVPICDTCIVTNEHKGHELGDITAVLSKQRDLMLAETKRLRDETVVDWEVELNKAQGITADYIGSIDEMEKELVSRAKEMHEEVETILSKSQHALQKMKATGLEKLKSQEKNLEDKIHQLKADVDQYENELRDADPNALIQFNQFENTGQRKYDAKPPSLEKPSLPVFTKGQNDSKAMQNIFGQLPTGTILQQSTELDQKPNQQPSAISNSDKTTVSSSYSASGGTERSLISNPSVQYRFTVDCSSPFIACVEQGLAWVRDGIRMSRKKHTYSTLKLVERDGSVKDEKDTMFAINDIAVTSDGDLLLANQDRRCIESMSRDKTINTLFSTKGEPKGLCCLHNNDIAVVTSVNVVSRKVTVYSRNGEIRQTLDHIKFRHPNKVSANKVNKHIYILCDYEKYSDDSDGKLIAVGADGKWQYEYTGQGDSVFTPVDVCTDKMGHVLITDSNSPRVHILNQEGRFIQYILTSQQGLCRPVTVDIDSDGYVWVGDEDNRKGRVMVVKYLK